MRRKLWTKSLALAMASIMAFSMAGCGKKNSDEDNDKQTEKETEVSFDKPDDNTVTAYNTTESNYQMSVDTTNQVHDISDLLFGVFIEDINFAADGGLYAEMIQNRSFEFTKLASDNEKHSWVDVGAVTANVTVKDAAGGLNENNTNYMVISNTGSTQAGIANTGWLDGMSVTKDGTYSFSIYAKGLDGFKGPITVSILEGSNVLATGTVPAVTAGWNKYELKLKTNAAASKNVKLQLTIGSGKVAVDMVSLFPEDTYKGRTNGMRKDLAEKLEALNPSFLRFPGGCVIEGNKLENAYDWKDSIGVDSNGNPIKFNGTYGDVAVRKQGQNIWTDANATNDPYPSFMSYGLGFFEYFQLAEDIGAIGVPVVNCGMACTVRGGDKTAIGSDEFKQYIQDALDLVEFCKGDKNTKWGAVRASLGHEAPFELKYIGIGNEQWGKDFYAHYEAFVDAFNEAKKTNPALYDGVEIMYSAGVDDGDSGADYMPAYEEASKWLAAHPGSSINDFAGAVDHHYYNDPEWFLSHSDYYDEANYSRDTSSMTTTRFGGGINVFLGEYAAKSNTLEAALAEAAYMTGLERNGDIVRMAAYAPLFGNLTATHWAPDLIWFNNTVSTGSINYYVQQLFGQNVGTKLLESKLDGAEAETQKTGLKGMVGVGTWSTSAKFDNIKVVSNDNDEVLGEQNFDDDTFKDDWTQVSDGTWNVKNGELIQSSKSTNTNKYATTGTAAYFGDNSWKNYTYTLDATKTGGDEGFLIPFAVGDKNNNFFWNIGGWGNTISCLQQVTDGSKSEAVGGTSKSIELETGKKYSLKIVVNDTNVKCYIDGKIYIDYDMGDNKTYEAYQVVSTDESGDIIIKLVNVTGESQVLAVDLKNSSNLNTEATVFQTAGTSLKNDNVLGKTEAVKLKEFKVTGIKNQFNYTVPKYSVTVIRVAKSK